MLRFRKLGKTAHYFLFKLHIDYVLDSKAISTTECIKIETKTDQSVVQVTTREIIELRWLSKHQ